VRSNFDFPTAEKERPLNTDRSAKHLGFGAGGYSSQKVSMVKKQVKAKVQVGFPDVN